MPLKDLKYLQDYCYNATVAGLSYIANPNLHFIERIFWLICVIAAGISSVLLIHDYEKNFESTAVSIVYETLPPIHHVHFPSLTVCDAPEGSEENPLVIEVVEELSPDKYEYDLENIIFLIMFPATHTSPTIRKACEAFDRKAGNVQCPKAYYRQLAKKLLANCTQYFLECSFNGKTFNCCDYFLPFTTPYGKCFMLNSLLNNNPGSKHWLDTTLVPLIDKPEIVVTTNRPIDAFILNAEDMPIYSFPGVSSKVKVRGERRVVEFSLETMLNDDDVREISPEGRRCRFTDELLPNSRYKAYSFTTCYAECVRDWQVKLCNCSLYSYLPQEDPYIMACDYEGFICVDDNQLVQPNPKRMLPWSPETPCNCLPSCAETDLLTIHENEATMQGKKNYSVKFFMPDWPTHRFHRQALRTRLDIVVSIGGILGLFMGVSILSFIELVYYFTVRLYNTLKRERQRQRHQQQQQQQQPTAK